jgi:hypothetical protein
MTKPSARSAATASRTTVRLTPVAAIISCSVGSRAPGASLPLIMSADRRDANSWVSPRATGRDLKTERSSGEALDTILTGATM